ncbi:MAG: hypothetical protein KGI37_06915 [Alphaproteobacteria bacterium]|nr:hypothetical protein [Alphaproteobacteria bacterium]
MQWVRAIFGVTMGCVWLAIGVAAAGALLPVIGLLLICLLVPPPFTMLVNLVFPVFYFIGPNGAHKGLNAMMSALRFILNKAADSFRAAANPE